MAPRPHTTAALFFSTLAGCCLLAFSGTAQTPAPASGGAPQGAAGICRNGFEHHAAMNASHSAGIMA